jgi:hypothetical protein
MRFNIYLNTKSFAIIVMICLSGLLSNAELPSKKVQATVRAVNTITNGIQPPAPFTANRKVAEENISNQEITANVEENNRKSNLIRNKKQLDPVRNSHLSKPTRVIKLRNPKVNISDVDQKMSKKFTSEVDAINNRLAAQEAGLRSN